MDDQEKIEQEIRKTLEQFEHPEQLPPNPWFHNQVMVRLQKLWDKKSTYAAILRPALLSALVLMNLGTAIWYFSGSKLNSQTSDRQQLIEMLAGDLKPAPDQNVHFLNE